MKKQKRRFLCIDPSLERNPPPAAEVRAVQERRKRAAQNFGKLTSRAEVEMYMRTEGYESIQIALYTFFVEIPATANAIKSFDSIMAVR